MDADPTERGRNRRASDACVPTCPIGPETDFGVWYEDDVPRA